MPSCLDTIRLNDRALLKYPCNELSPCPDRQDKHTGAWTSPGEEAEVGGIALAEATGVRIQPVTWAMAVAVVTSGTCVADDSAEGRLNLTAQLVGRGSAMAQSTTQCVSSCLETRRMTGLCASEVSL